MKVYQCFHKYAPYISYFEDKYRPKENGYSFDKWRTLLIKDGFASCNVLKPAFEGKTEEIFYTIWDYEALQQQWALENGLKTNNLDEIKLAQIEKFNPDVFYNISPYYDGNFIQKIRHKKNLVKICWDSVITSKPAFHEDYDLRFSLFEPFVKFWNQHGFPSFLFPPAFEDSWDNLGFNDKSIDILFYGQFQEYFFSERNSTLIELAKWAEKRGYKFNFHLQFSRLKKPLINKRILRDWTRWLPVAPPIISKNSLPPIYGRLLYETIAKSRIVVNGFGNFNGLFKENMRNYEATGCGSFLISEDGIYPEGFVPGADFLTYRTNEELFEKIDYVLSLPDKGLQWTLKTREKLKSIYSKEKQWQNFLQAVQSTGKLN